MVSRAGRRLCGLVATAGFVFFLGFLPSAVAATIYVPDKDHPTIQAAVDAANPGDIIVVGPGTYTEPISINEDKVGITITSANGPSETVILAQGETPVLDISGKEIILRGFTIHKVPVPGGSIPAVMVNGSSPFHVGSPKLSLPARR